MSLIYQHRIYRKDLKANPSVLYLFGDNEARAGYGGQAKECRGEPNAVGIATKIKPSRYEDAYWSDDDYDRCAKIIMSDFKPVIKHWMEGGIIIVPSDGLGTGLSELPSRAPKLLEFINSHIEALQK